ncbi:MAG: nonstructural protein [Arizlama microvirus]|nr:MAG: nonstructural protein [Arizlama microvirus]
MKLVICTVKDRAADAYGRPMFVPSTGVAIRSFSDEINRNHADNQLYNHPDDFDLYELGEFDDNTGLFTLHEQPKLLSLGKQVKVS